MIFSRFVIITCAAVNFGMWQNNAAAGCFAWCILAYVYEVRRPGAK